MKYFDNVTSNINGQLYLFTDNKHCKSWALIKQNVVVSWLNGATMLQTDFQRLGEIWKLIKYDIILLLMWWEFMNEFIC